ncbi:unnamed protein product [Ectocarpus sp. 12 AP-2014]
MPDWINAEETCNLAMQSERTYPTAWDAFTHGIVLALSCQLVLLFLRCIFSLFLCSVHSWGVHSDMMVRHAFSLENQLGEEEISCRKKRERSNCLQGLRQQNVSKQRPVTGYGKLPHLGNPLSRFCRGWVLGS